MTMSSESGSETTTDEWDKVSQVVSSKYRVGVVSSLADKGPATPTGISADTGHSVAHVSRALQELKELGVVELLVSEERQKGRLYGITSEGQSVQRKVTEVSR